jgi:hypothetical protein|tara:strand:+ start:3896 stop:4165 length:270 start_codon:yes stop_codon:yes gene_type:complete
MAYTPASLTCLASGSGVNLFHYTSADTAATINTADYFLASYEKFNVNDIILSVSASGGTPVVTILYVSAVTSATVDVVDGTVVSATDTD